MNETLAFIILQNSLEVSKINTFLVNQQTLINETDILKWFKEHADRYDNIRILKTKMEQAIYEELAKVFIFENKKDKAN